MVIEVKIIASFEIDPEKGFTHQCNELAIDGGDEIVPELNENAKLAVYRYLSRDMHPKGAAWETETPELIGQLMEKQLPEVDRHWVAHCEFGTKGAELLDGLPHPILGYDFTIVKGFEKDVHPYGACYHDLSEQKPTGIISEMIVQGVTHVILGGLAFDFCVATTAMQLARTGKFKVIINKAATRSVSPETEVTAKQQLEDAGVVILKDAKAVKEYLGK